MAEINRVKVTVPKKSGTIIHPGRAFRFRAQVLAQDGETVRFSVRPCEDKRGLEEALW